MKKDLTDITFILDRSGSMMSIRDDTIGGFNSFILSQRALPGRCVVSLIQFDDQYESVYAGYDISRSPLLNTKTYAPRGSTALIDAMAKTITQTGARLAELPESSRPANVIIVTLTDGHENASREFTRAQLFDMITLQRQTYNWQFIFLGANQDAIQEAAGYGIDAGQTMTYASTGRGTGQAFDSVGTLSASIRSGTQSASFSAADRQAQKDAGA